MITSHRVHAVLTGAAMAAVPLQASPPSRPDAPRLETKPIQTTESGGPTTVNAKGRKSFALPLANIRPETLKAHTVGNSFFNENWTSAPASAVARDGLGPFFHARSCSACHLFDGRGKPPEQGEVMTSLLLRLSIPGTDEHGMPKPDPVYGNQLAPRALAGLEPEAEVDLSWQDVPVKFPDGTQRTLIRPQIRVVKWNYGPPAEGIMLGARVAPSVFGLGLLEAVHDSRLQLYADTDDKDGDGISGRANMVWNPVTGQQEIGRFGWKANTASLHMQTADAAHGDMGLTSVPRPEENHTSAQKAAAAFPTGADAPHAAEISPAILDSMVTYVRTIAPPARRDVNDPDVVRGQQLFHDIRCVACHVPALRTNRPDALPELRWHTIRPYTDLLLHDMGPDLADNRPDGQASGSEWRTAPLWGMGLQEIVSGHTRFLHDGRARNAEEAILWHGGEAQKSRDAYMALPADDREKVLRFLKSL